jgi:biopolymer transport protein ExbD
MITRNSASKGKRDVQLAMTPMIDIVFQLLVFFVMTLKIVAPEGDFSIKMPLSAGPPRQSLAVPMEVRMLADAEGRLSDLDLNGERLTGFPELRDRIVTLMARADGQTDLELALNADQTLRYEHVIQAIDAVTGQREADGSITHFVERVRLVPPTTR